MHPPLHRAPFTRGGWIFEHNLDGFRALAGTGRAPALLSRNGLSYSAAFPEIMGGLRRCPVEAVLDCELVVVDAGGRPQWSACGDERGSIALAPRRQRPLQSRLPYTPSTWSLSTSDLRERPLLERKKRLAELVDGIPYVHYVEHLEAHDEALFAKVCAFGRR